MIINTIYTIRSDIMEGKESTFISEIRSFNRFYTKILGLLDKHILDSPYSLTEVRILLEIGKLHDCTANKLVAKLDIDRGYMSRVLKGFEKSGLIEKKESSEDKRFSILRLTDKGSSILSELEGRSDRQVEGLIGHMSEEEKQKLVASMRSIKSAMLSGINPVQIRTYEKTDLEYVINRHRELYAVEYGFGTEFTDYVEKYVKKFDEYHDADKENIWIAEEDGRPVGMIAIVKADESTAQLRWFLIEPEARGLGLGYMLMNTVMDFCLEKGYKHIFLWTVSILGAARKLYKSFGFKLTETKTNDSWGKELVEERWDTVIREPYLLLDK